MLNGRPLKEVWCGMDVESIEVMTPATFGITVPCSVSQIPFSFKLLEAITTSWLPNKPIVKYPISNNISEENRFYEYGHDDRI